MAGMECSIDSLTDGSCTMNTYEILWVEPRDSNKTLKGFTQDFFGWFTMFIGFVVFIALVYSGFLMIMWWADEKQFENWKKWVIYSIIWLLLVWWAYWIIRLVQLIAKW